MAGVEAGRVPTPERALRLTPEAVAPDLRSDVKSPERRAEQALPPAPDDVTRVRLDDRTVIDVRTDNERVSVRVHSATPASYAGLSSDLESALGGSGYRLAQYEAIDLAPTNRRAPSAPAPQPSHVRTHPRGRVERIA